MEEGSCGGVTRCINHGKTKKNAVPVSDLFFSALRRPYLEICGM